MTDQREWRALTVTQPWAEEVAQGHKQWETRSWTTNYRGLVAIHAAKGYPREAQDFAAEEYVIGRIPGRLAFGAIIAIARVVDVQPTEEIAPQLSGLERYLGDYTPGRYAWALTEVRRLPEPIPCRGALSLWRPPRDVEDALNAALELVGSESGR